MAALVSATRSGPLGLAVTTVSGRKVPRRVLVGMNMSPGLWAVNTSSSWRIWLRRLP